MKPELGSGLHVVDKNFKIGDYVYATDTYYKYNPYSIGQIEKIEEDRVYCKWSLRRLKNLPATMVHFNKILKKTDTLFILMHEIKVLNLKGTAEKVDLLTSEDIFTNPLLTSDKISLITKKITDIDNYDSSTLISLSNFEKLDMDKIIQIVVQNAIKIIAKIPA